MPLMNLFEPLFLLLALATVITLVTAAIRAVMGQFVRARRILLRLGIGAAAYFAIVIAVSAASPGRVYQRGDAQCFDDWCITVVSGGWTDAAPVRYEVALRLSNRARRVPMGEKGTVVYLTDANGRRYDPLAEGADVAFDTLIPPGESLSAVRRFDVPRTATGLGLVYTHEGGFPIGWLIISEGGWFQTPPVVRLN